MKRNLVVLQSGGPTSVINTSLKGIIDAIKKGDTYEKVDDILGSLNGIYGLINDNIIDLNKEDEKEIELLVQTPGAILGSARHQLKDDISDIDYKKIDETVKKHNIKYIILIGGNDSMDSTNKLAKFYRDSDVHVVGVPKTIDNDLYCTYACPGYGSAAKYIANTITTIIQDATSYTEGRINIIEIMGRDAGWLTASSKLVEGVDFIYLPESPFNLNKFLDDVKNRYSEKKHVFVCVSEGIKDASNKYVQDYNIYTNNTDSFGHVQLGGVSNVLATIIQTRLKIKVRAIELNLSQRCATYMSSKYDIDKAYLLGYHAASAVTLYTSLMITDGEYVNTNSVANRIKEFPSEWIVNGNDISEEYLKYARELIAGENNVVYENGIIKMAKFKKIRHE